MNEKDGNKSMLRTSLHIQYWSASPDLLESLLHLTQPENEEVSIPSNVSSPSEISSSSEQMLRMLTSISVTAGSGEK